jgi:hypothetical protein
VVVVAGCGFGVVFFTTCLGSGCFFFVDLLVTGFVFAGGFVWL